MTDVAFVAGAEQESAQRELTAPPVVQRLALVDNARAIGIVLVVAGHAPGFPPLLVNTIFAFHMPLFFVLSGLLVGPQRLTLSTLHRAQLLARTLLLPYLFYFIVAYVYWLVAKRHGLRAAEMEALPWWDPLKGFVGGSADGLYVDVVLWFFPCLFVTALAHHMLRKRLSTGATCLVVAAVAFGFILLRSASQARWPWSADCAIVALPFYAVGSALHKWSHRRVPVASGMQRFALGACAGLGCFGLTLAMGRTDLNHLMFGSLPAAYPMLAGLGVVAVLAAASVMPATRPAYWLSMNTLVIFPLHFLMFSVITGFAIVVLRLDPTFKDASWSVGIAYTVIALLWSWPAAAILRKAVPWLIGGSAARGVVRAAAVPP